MTTRTFRDVLAELNAGAQSTAEKGRSFERLVKAFLEWDKVQAQRFTRVWLWSDWPGNGGRHDTGIDIVAEERDGGNLVAIQCKFYGPSSRIVRDEANKFLTAYGTTTGVDAGSAGFLNYGAMRDYVFPAHRTRLIAFLHIGGVGLAANRVLGGGLHDMRIIDVAQTVQAIRDNPGFVFGVKVRMHYDAVARWNAHEAMAKAREAASEAGVRLMVHVSGTPIPLPDVLEHLGPGDISTHAFNGNPESMLDNAGKVRPEVRDAVQRGVIMDVGHAGVHCDVEVVRAAMDQGVMPDTISTDVHIAPPGRTVYLMNDLVSKFHAMGMTLSDAIAASASRPAQVLGLQDSIGSLAVGMEGDAAVWEQRQGRFVWHDMAGHNVDGSLRLDTFATIKAGSVAWREGRLTQMGEC